LATGRQAVATGLEPAPFRLGCMTIQSSFLIRCSLSASGGITPGKAYYIQHVQTGAEFRSAALTEVTEWVAGQNLRYLSEVIRTESAPPEDVR